MRSYRWVALSSALAVSVVLAACSSEDAASRARDAAKKIQAQIVDVQATALAQTAPPEKVKQAQQYLKAVSQYLGDINGKLDSVTVNAVEAFQREHNLEDSGLLTDSTMEALHDAALKEERQKKAG